MLSNTNNKISLLDVVSQIDFIEINADDTMRLNMKVFQNRIIEIKIQSR